MISVELSGVTVRRGKPPCRPPTWSAAMRHRKPNNSFTVRGLRYQTELREKLDGFRQVFDRQVDENFGSDVFSFLLMVD
jgi:hypothetical protein